MEENRRHTYTVGDEEESGASSLPNNSGGGVWWIIRLILVIFFFLLALEWMSTGLKLWGDQRLLDQMKLGSNPFLGLFIGILATSILQSSSAVTTMVVGLVAAGSVGLAPATPIILGANIGTSVTSMIVALGLIGQRKEFGRGVSTAALHGLFNIFGVLILFPLELTTGALSSSAEQLASWLFSLTGGVETASGLLTFTTGRPTAFLLNITSTSEYPQGNPFILLGIGLLALFLSLRILIQLFESRMAGQVRTRMNQYLFGHPRQAFMTGLLSTAALQSSSVTTSLMVPLSAQAKIALPRVFAYLIGTNIGTTVTALMAAIFLGSSSEVALAIAFVHLLFNCIGTLIMFPIPFIRNIPIALSTYLGKAARDNRIIPVIYLVLIYFIIPGLLVLVL